MLGVNKPTGAAVAVALPEAPSHSQRLHTEFTARLVSWPAKKGSDPSCYSCLLMSPRLDRPSERRLSQAAPHGVWSILVIGDVVRMVGMCSRWIWPSLGKVLEICSARHSSYFAKSWAQVGKYKQSHDYLEEARRIREEQGLSLSSDGSFSVGRYVGDT